MVNLLAQEGNAWWRASAGISQTGSGTLMKEKRKEKHDMKKRDVQD
jgi:hypothetical protein